MREDHRGRHRRGRHRPGGHQKKLLEPIQKQRHLDLSLPADAPLFPEELKEAEAHVAFLRRFKGILRLGLNAQEDLLINGQRAPTDRGILKHLLAKVDKTTIEQALRRDALQKNPKERAAFLGGAAGLGADLDLVLQYLEALADSDDRSTAAAGFALTVAQIPFESIQAKPLAQLFSVIAKTFEGSDRIRAFFELLQVESMRKALEGGLGALPSELKEAFGPLMTAHRVVVRGEPAPSDEEDDGSLARGVALLLEAPEGSLRTHPEPVRARLAELALAQGASGQAKDAVRRILKSLPKKNPAYVDLWKLRIDELLGEGALDEARALVGELGAALPNDPWIAGRKKALADRKAGKITVGPRIEGTGLVQAFWLEGPAPVLARVGAVSDAGKLSFEAKIQAELALPRVAPILAHGLGEDGTPYLAMPDLGGPIKRELEGLSFAERIPIALELGRCLVALFERGLVLPDAQLSRFGLGSVGPVLYDLSGLERLDRERALLTLPAMLRGAIKAVLQPVNDPRLKARLAANTPVAVLMSELARAAALNVDR
ncbi:MAG: hypothetical protein U1E65_23505 [Myxococcota bacterium]